MWNYIRWNCLNVSELATASAHFHTVRQLFMGDTEADIDAWFIVFIDSEVQRPSFNHVAWQLCKLLWCRNLSPGYLRSTPSKCIQMCMNKMCYVRFFESKLNCTTWGCSRVLGSSASETSVAALRRWPRPSAPKVYGPQWITMDYKLQGCSVFVFQLISSIFILVLVSILGHLRLPKSMQTSEPYSVLKPKSRCSGPGCPKSENIHFAGHAASSFNWTCYFHANVWFI